MHPKTTDQFRMRTCIACGALALAGTLHAQPFRADIDRWVAQDALASPSRGAILFTGSSSIRRYEQLALDFADYRIVQRGFGGAQFDHVNGYIDQIVLPYQPRAIVVWAGTNDLAAGDTGTEVVADYDAFVQRVHAELPETDIFFLGIMPTPGRFANGPEETVANLAVAQRAAASPRLHYIDLPAAFQALDPPNDPAFTSKFVDPIHLSGDGYELWTSVIRPQLEAVVPPNKPMANNPLSPRPGAKLLIDFGPNNPEDGDHTASPDARGHHWNNWHPAIGEAAINAGEHLADLIDTAGSPTGIDLTITGGFLSNGKLNGGLFDPDPTRLGDLAVTQATQDYFFLTADGVQGGGNDDVPGGFMLDGLDPQLTYELRFLGSRDATATRITEYRVTGTTEHVVRLQTSGNGIGADGRSNGNDDEVAVVTGVQPDAYGQVFVDLTLIEGAFAYVNAMEVVVLPEPAGLGTLSLLGLTALRRRRSAR